MPTSWRTANHEVRRLQVRIVKAVQENRWGKVQALQRLLTHSFSGKAMAVKRVTENQGKRTPGVDQVIWNTSAEESIGRTHIEAKRLSFSSSAPCVHREKQRPEFASSGHSDDERQSDAGTISARS